MKITKKTKFSEALMRDPDVAEVFMKNGMYCLGCPMAGEETIEQGCEAHGIDADKVVDEINKKLEKKAEK
ncbi:MAG: DUF1858 domain-containing protein [Nanoarchaeota archaeon]|nr:DUF1858 domain-containing protein [Nanoarchaeota archaeon]